MRGLQQCFYRRADRRKHGFRPTGSIFNDAPTHGPHVSNYDSAIEDRAEVAHTNVCERKREIYVFLPINQADNYTRRRLLKSVGSS